MNKKIHLFGKTIKVSHILLTIIMFGIAFFDNCTISLGAFSIIQNI